MSRAVSTVAALIDGSNHGTRPGIEGARRPRASSRANPLLIAATMAAVVPSPVKGLRDRDSAAGAWPNSSCGDCPHGVKYSAPPAGNVRVVPPDARDPSEEGNVLDAGIN